MKYNFYREGEFIKMMDCTLEEAIHLVKRMLYNFHTMWTFKKT